MKKNLKLNQISYNFYDDLKDKALKTDDKDDDPNKIDLNVVRLVRPRDCINCIYDNIKNDSHCYSCCKKLENNFKPKINECKYCLYYNMNDGHCGPCKKGIKIIIKLYPVLSILRNVKVAVIGMILV